MMGDRIPGQRPRPESAPAPRIKLYNLRVTGPSTEGEETTVAGLALDHVVTALLILEVGDSATVECVEETTDWGMVI